MEKIHRQKIVVGCGGSNTKPIPCVAQDLRSAGRIHFGFHLDPLFGESSLVLGWDFVFFCGDIQFWLADPCQGIHGDSSVAKHWAGSALLSKGIGERQKKGLGNLFVYI